MNLVSPADRLSRDLRRVEEALERGDRDRDRVRVLRPSCFDFGEVSRSLFKLKSSNLLCKTMYLNYWYL